MNKKSKNNYEVHQANLNDYDEWKKFVSDHEEGMIYAYPEFQKILNKAYKVKNVIFLAKNKQKKIVGVLILYYYKWNSVKKEIHSPPYGLVIKENECIDFLFDKLKLFCEKNGIIKTQIEFFDKISNNKYKSLVKTTIYKYLQRNIEDEWNALRSKTRNIIRKAIKNNVYIEEGHKYLDKWYEIYNERMLQIKVAPQKKIFFELLFKTFKNNAELSVAVHQGKVIGGVIFLNSKFFMYYHSSAQSNKARDLGVNEFLIWNIFKKAHLNSIKYLDLGRATKNGNVYKFKVNGLGGLEKKIYFYDVINSKIFSKSEVPIIYKFNNRIVNYIPNFLRKYVLQYNKSFEHLI